MGNKNTIPLKGPNTGTVQREEGLCVDCDTGGVSRGGGPSPELLASLQSLRETSDYTMLPHSLHQIAEAYSLREDYHWALQFLQLEKLYHQRLLSNLADMQENWESQWREKNDGGLLAAETDSIRLKHIETLDQICRTHLRPSISVQQNTVNQTKDIQSEDERQQACHNEGNKTEATFHEEEKEQSVNQTGQQERGEEEDRKEKETCEDGQEVEEETPEEEVKVEWPSGVPQASVKDLARHSHTEGSSYPDGLVSILKRRRASLDGLLPPSDIVTKQNPKRKVRFSEPEEGLEQDEMGGDSCLILLLLCLVTVVISIGGTAFYCTLVDTYSNICTDFTNNADFYVVTVRRFFEGFAYWLPLQP
ncbi:consortin, connexin sorting protein b isoform 2-T3 [Spinachia spinachia]